MSSKSLHSASDGAVDPPTFPWGRTPRIRTRTISSAGITGEDFYRYQTPLTQSHVIRVNGRQRTVDTVAKDWKSNPNRNADSGGNLDSRRIVVLPHPERVNLNRTVVSGQPDIATYRGDVFADAELLQLAQHIESPEKVKIPVRFGALEGASRNQMTTWGATAVNRTIPIAPPVSVANTLGELKEGLPSLSLKALRRGNIGGEYLNYTFGIAPTVSDFQAYKDANRKAEKILSQWKRDSGRRIRRRYQFPEEITTKVESRTGYPTGARVGLNANLYSGTGNTLTITTTTTRNVWFSGAYQYYIPDVANDLLAPLREFDRVYGAVPTLSTAWELTPFSWLLDWETNMGDVISNISLLGKDGLVLTYGYIMCHSQVVTEYVWKGEVYHGTGKFPQTFRSVVISDIKQREAANPYGLGWTIESLSKKQIAILAALGLSSKAPR